MDRTLWTDFSPVLDTRQGKIGVFYRILGMPRYFPNDAHIETDRGWAGCGFMWETRREIS
jgi:hypothetical protein